MVWSVRQPTMTVMGPCAETVRAAPPCIPALRADGCTLTLTEAVAAVKGCPATKAVTWNLYRRPACQRRRDVSHVGRP